MGYGLKNGYVAGENVGFSPVVGAADEVVIDHIDHQLAVVAAVPAEVLVAGIENEFPPTVKDTDAKIDDLALVVFGKLERVVQPVALAGRDGVG